MSHESFWQADILCPFYISDDGKQRIRCEGVEGSNHTLLFYRKKCSMKSQVKGRCSANYEECKVYKMLMTKYEE